MAGDEKEAKANPAADDDGKVEEPDVLDTPINRRRLMPCGASFSVFVFRRDT